MTEREAYDRWFLGNEAAMECMGLLVELSQLVDDIVDQDKHDREERSAMAVRVFHIALLALPSNSYWVTTMSWLAPAAVTSAVQWDCSNDWQHGNAQHQVFGYVQREALEQVAIQIALHLGGSAWARQVAREMHEFYHHTHREDDGPAAWAAEAAE